METFTIDTHERFEIVSITQEIKEHLAESGLREGAVLVFVPHTTAGVTINENADPDVLGDLKLAIERNIPDHSDYRHAEGNSDAHVRSSLVGCSLLIPVENGTLALGTWQGIYFCEFDGPRRRRVLVQYLASTPAC
jgi:secondary thiamine-phosphate synthase enzyme